MRGQRDNKSLPRKGPIRAATPFAAPTASPKTIEEHFRAISRPIPEASAFTSPAQRDFQSSLRISDDPFVPAFYPNEQSAEYSTLGRPEEPSPEEEEGSEEEASERDDLIADAPLMKFLDSAIRSGDSGNLARACIVGCAHGAWTVVPLAFDLQNVQDSVAGGRVGAYMIGGAVGAVLAGWGAETRGRIWALQVRPVNE